MTMTTPIMVIETAAILAVMMITRTATTISVTTAITNVVTV